MDHMVYIDLYCIFLVEKIYIISCVIYDPGNKLDVDLYDQFNARVIDKKSTCQGRFRNYIF